MINRLFGIAISFVLAASSGAEPGFEFDFNAYEIGPIEGQFGWNIFEKVKDSSAISIMDQLGTIERNGDKALVIQASSEEIRCVTGEPVRWLPGRTLMVEFDFKVAVEANDQAITKPVMTMLFGNALLSEKTSWALQLDATPDGDWRLSGAMPDIASQKIYGETLLIRSDSDVSISEWHRIVLVAKKLSTPDSFEVTAELQLAKNNEVLMQLEFTDIAKNKVTKAMWNNTRTHAGFVAPKDQLGLLIIDNLKISAIDAIIDSVN